MKRILVQPGATSVWAAMLKPGMGEAQERKDLKATASLHPVSLASQPGKK